MTEANQITITNQDDMVEARVECAHMEDQHAQALLVQVAAAADESPSTPFVLDLSNVAVMPSMSIGVLVTLWKRFRDSGQRLILAGLQPQVRRTLTLCRIDKLLDICDSVEEARQRLAADRGGEGDSGR
jgi:anti-anti-sigma factor